MDIIDSIGIAFNLLIIYWWVYIPIILFLVCINLWADYTRAKYLRKLEWILLELKFPQEVTTSFKAAEQVFAGLHGIFIKPVTWDEEFFGGKLPDWFSLEIVGSGGETHFYIRTLKAYRNLVESNIYAQYPEAEISQVEDYIDVLPKHVPNDQYDLWGMELELSKDNFYPIRTYPYFEEVGQFGKEKKIIDPLSSLSEILGTLKLNEHLWIQLLIRPTGDGWIEASKAEVDKILGREKKEDGSPAERLNLSPGEKVLAESIAAKTSKFGFESTLRFIYVAPKDIFSIAYGAGVSGVYKQFGTQDRNGFKANRATIPIASWAPKFMGNWPFKLIPYPGKKVKELERKRKLYEWYRDRAFTEKGKPFILNTEELATLYHIPSLEVKAPLLNRLEAKKGTPPAGLPQ